MGFRGWPRCQRASYWRAAFNVVVSSKRRKRLGRVGRRQLGGGEKRNLIHASATGEIHFQSARTGGVLGLTSDETCISDMSEKHSFPRTAPRLLFQRDRQIMANNAGFFE